MPNTPLSVRFSDSERDALEVAASHARTTVSDFIRRGTMDAVEIELMERRTIVIPAEAWERFEARVNAPAKDVPAIRRLADSRPVWES